MTVVQGHAQQPRIIKLPELQQIFNSQNDTTYVINFWATWCVPCVKEFPAFQALADAHQGEKVQVVMVSLDFKKDFDTKLLPFINQHPIKGNVYLLNEPDYNSWINKINPDWQGEIPVTFILNNSRKIREFFAHDFTTESLKSTYADAISLDTFIYKVKRPEVNQLNAK